MPLTPADFLQPLGPLTADQFPLTEGERAGGVTPEAKAEALLSGWIGRGREAALAARPAVRGAAAAHYVLYRAYSAIADRLYGGPARLSVDGGESSSQYLNDQMKHFHNRALAELAAFEALVGAPSAKAGRWAVVHHL